jgi:hypothetical protein
MSTFFIVNFIHRPPGFCVFYYTFFGGWGRQFLPTPRVYPYLVFVSCLRLESTELNQNSFTSLIRSANSSNCLVCFVKSNIMFSFKLVRVSPRFVHYTIHFVAVQHVYTFWLFLDTFCRHIYIFYIPPGGRGGKVLMGVPYSSYVRS